MAHFIKCFRSLISVFKIEQISIGTMNIPKMIKHGNKRDMIGSISKAFSLEMIKERYGSS